MRHSHQPRSAPFFIAAMGAVGLLATGCDNAGNLAGSADPLVTINADQTSFVLADLSGDFYFVLRDGDGRMLFTKRGEMQIASDQRITSPDGFFVQGYAVDDNFQINTSSLTDLTLPLGTLRVSVTTTQAIFEGILSSGDTNVGESIIVTFSIFDRLGATIDVRLIATLSSVSESISVWDVVLSREQDQSLLGSEIYIFDADGNLQLDPQLRITLGNGEMPQEISLNFQTVRGDRDLNSALIVSSVDGAPIGTLNDYAIEATGKITGFFTNGLSRDVGQLVVALIRNPESLVAESAGVFSAGPNTSEPFITTGSGP